MSQQINLYDPALRPKREWLTANRVAAATGLVLLVMGVWGAWLRAGLGQAEAAANAASQGLKQGQEEMTTLSREMAGRKPDQRLEQELTTSRLLLSVRSEVLALLSKGLGPGATGFSDYLRGLSRQASDGLWLTGFSVSGNGSTMEIQGRLLDPAMLPDYIRRLNGEKVFQGHTFSALRMTAVMPTPATAAGTSGAAVPPASGVAIPRYHEFVLVPARDEKGAESTTSKPEGRP